MSRVPTTLTESFVNGEPVWISKTSTSNTTWTEIFPANANRRRGVMIFNVGDQAIRWGEADEAASGGALMYGMAQVSGVTTTVLGPTEHFYQSSGAVWFKRNGASGTATVVAYEV